MTLQLQPNLVKPSSCWNAEALESEPYIEARFPLVKVEETIYTNVDNAASSPVLDGASSVKPRLGLFWQNLNPPKPKCNTATWYDSPLNLESKAVTFKKGGTNFGPVSITLQSGDFLVITGQTELARTTFSRMLVGLVRPVQGCIYANGQDLSRVSQHRLAIWRQAHVNIVSNHTPLWKMLTVLDNLLLPSYNQGNSALLQHQAEAMQLLKLAHLEDLSNCVAAELTPEQAKMVVFLRGFIKQPQLLVFDHITDEFSPATEQLIWQILNYYAKNGVAIVRTATPLQLKSWQAAQYLPEDFCQVSL
jgi:putative ABC transport system ATP-binding protein